MIGRRPGIFAASAGIPWLLVPALLFLIVIFGWPLLYLLRMSFNDHTGANVYVEAWTLNNYIEVLTNPLYLTEIGKTLYISLVTAVITVVAAFFFAQFVWLRDGGARTIFLAIALAPMLISEVSVIIGWRMFFPFNGLFSYFLVSTGLSDQKVNLLGTEIAAVVGLSYISVSYCFFSILSVLNGIDRNLLTASADLGASPMRTFFTVLLPLAKGGIAAAFTQAFVFTMGIYATTNALGPDSLWTVPYEIQLQMLTRRNWPMAAALSVVLILIIAMAALLTQWLRHRKGRRYV
ncbi:MULTISPECIES: ABC transporter permease [unclassified Hyphomicrobium]|uniref:ABC transporter permease n=1 Tax=unclassified Hyphomicrobium TaxID=2619925 RepID=UPI0012F4D738|nr:MULTISPECIES: ABC transporter permease [unclassified Hyphomicrobium]